MKRTQQDNGDIHNYKLDTIYNCIHHIQTTTFKLVFWSMVYSIKTSL